jgi:hypothetical protein
MTDWNTIEKIRSLEADANRLGFKFAKSQRNVWNDQHGAICLMPLDAEAVPIYSRDAEIFVGTLEELEYWLQGVHWARRYDNMLKISNDKKRAKAEQTVHKEHLMRTLKAGELVTGQIKSLVLD